MCEDAVKNLTRLFNSTCFNDRMFHSGHSTVRPWGRALSQTVHGDSLESECSEVQGVTKKCLCRTWVRILLSTLKNNCTVFQRLLIFGFSHFFPANMALARQGKTIFRRKAPTSHLYAEECITGRAEERSVSSTWSVTARTGS